MFSTLQKIFDDADLSDEELDLLVVDTCAQARWEDENSSRLGNDDVHAIVSRLVSEIKMLRNQKKLVRIVVDYHEDDCMIPAGFNSIVEEGKEGLLIAVGESALVKWDDAETETRVEVRIGVIGIETE